MSQIYSKKTKTDFEPADGRLRNKLYHVIFESEPGAGRAFDLVLIVAIIASVLVVMIESIPSVHDEYRDALIMVEWIFTGLFTVEYLVRLACVKQPLKYATSFFGIIDLLSVLPSFIALAVPQGRYLMIVRVLRLLRIFRILKLTLYIDEANVLMRALRASRRKIWVFICAVMALVTVVGSAMYVIEGPASGFTSIPRSVYWAIVTLTTVGYGDIAPITPLGQLFASIVMLMGYAIIAVPTGIVTSELANMKSSDGHDANRRACNACGTQTRANDAKFCRVCGESLPEE